MVDASQEKEQRARETIQSLKLEITNLSRLVEQGAGLTMGQEHRSVGQAIKPMSSLVWDFFFFGFNSILIYLDDDVVVDGD